jgi:hypothetical protein
MRLASHECRWFFTGTPGQDVVERFIAAGNWKRKLEIPRPTWPEKWRDDRYEFLARGVAAQVVDFGIKLRDERVYGKALKFEYKARTSVLGAVRLAPDATGIVERWIKWSYQDDEVPSALWRPFEDGELGTLVQKKRLLRKIRLDAADEDEEVPASGPGSRVCFSRTSERSPN